MAKIKVCGITNDKDAFYAATLGANYLGFNFESNNDKKTSLKTAVDIISKLPPISDPVGLFCNDETSTIKKTVKKCSLKFIQLNGQETPEYIRQLKTGLPEIKIIKQFKVIDASVITEIEKYNGLIDYLLLDAYVEQKEGETAGSFNWDIVIEIKKLNIPVFLSGNLTPENVRDAIEKVQPFGVNVDSGVERLPRRKDFNKLKQFILKAI